MILRDTVIIWFIIMQLFVSGCGKNVIDSQTKKTGSNDRQDALRIAGSGSNIPTIVKLGEAYAAKTGTTIEVPGSIGSDGAINALKANDLELGIISRPLTAEEREIGLKEIPYARIGIVFAAHSDVPDLGFSDNEIIEILKGSKTTWADNSKIFVIMRQANESLNLVLFRLVPNYQSTFYDALESQRWKVVYREKDMADALINTKGAFGITNTTEILKSNSRIKALKLNGISPSIENIHNGAYKPVITLSFVYKDTLNNRASKFLEYVFSPEGSQILEKWGAIPEGS